VEALQLAPKATLETRDAKHEPRTLAEQRTAWHTEAAETLGGPGAVRAMISKTLSPISITSPEMNGEWVAATAEKVLAVVEERRSTWQSWHVRAEALRHIRAAEIDSGKVEQLVELLVDEVLQTRSVALTLADDGIREPAALRRSDGSSVYTVAGSDLFTSTRILVAEQRLVAAAGRTDGRVLDAATVDLALLESAVNGNRWMPGRPLWFVPCAPRERGCSWPSRPLAPGRPPPCPPSLGRGAIAAARCSGWPRRPPRRRNSATPPAHQPKRWRS
jgi:hypothetical protein